jgi:hypothetical protein
MLRCMKRGEFGVGAKERDFPEILESDATMESNIGILESPGESLFTAVLLHLRSV